MRISWEKYALELAKTASLRSEDPFLKVGACVLRNDNTVASLGYNGAPTGISINWLDREERRKRVIHAESNALKWIRPGEAKLIATTIAPCPACVTLIASYLIPKIIFIDEYDKDVDSLSIKLCQEFGIQFHKIT